MRRKSFWIVIILGVALMYPMETTVLPPQSVLVVTRDWRPIQGVMVRQIWQHYSIESNGHEQDLKTDENGRLVFPGRTIRASILRRTLHPCWNVLTHGAHASFGIHTDVFTVNGGSETRIGENTVKARPEEVVFHL